MRCPHCNRVHPDQSHFCPVTGRVIDPPQIQETPNPQPSNRWVSPVMAVLGILLIVAGVLLVQGNFSLPAWDSSRAASNPSNTAQAGQSSGAHSSPTPSGNPQQPSNAARTTPSAQPATPTVVPRNPDLDEWIVYTYGKENDSEIYMLQPSTGKTRQLTSNRYNDDGPTLLARTNELVFSSSREEGWELYLLDLNTMKESQLTHFDGQARFPEWSPVAGARKILFEGRKDSSNGKLYSIWLLDLDTNRLTDLTQGSADSRPQWSPDGKEVVFGRALNDSDQNGKITTADFLSIFTYNLASGDLTRVTNDPTVDNYQFTWSPDGEWILFGSARTDVNGDSFVNLDDSRNLWLIHPDGSNEHELRLNDESIFSPGWSPSGNSIVFTTHQGENREEMWLYDLLTTETTLLQTAGPIYHTEFAVRSR